MLEWVSTRETLAQAAEVGRSPRRSPVRVVAPKGRLSMTTLDVSTPGELRLTLRGAAENAILTTLRRWPYWLRVELEHDQTDAAQCVAVTLITGRNQEATLREILRRSFGLIFPPEGGETALRPAPEPRSRRRGFAARPS